MSEYPRMLYRPGTGTRAWGIDCDTRIVRDADEQEAAAKEGWTLRPDGEPSPLKEALKASIAAEDAHPLDHDKDGEKGGSITAPGDLKALRAEYREVVGKRAFNGWAEAELLARIAKAKEGVDA